MGSLSDFAENELLDHLFNAAYTPAATVYIGLSTADPTDDGSGITEPSGNGYARESIAFSAAASRKVVQNGAVEFDQATGAWGEITHWFVCDHLTNATFGTNVNLLAHGSFSSSFSPVAGNTPSIATTEVEIEISATSGGAGFTTACVNALLDLMFRNQSYTSPAGNTFLALLAAVADDADSTMADVTEITGTDYARKEVNPNGGSSPTWDAASGGSLDNGAAITFATPGSGGWDEVVAVAICTALTGTAADILAYDNTNIVDQTPAEGDTVQFAAGAFDASLS